MLEVILLLITTLTHYVLSISSGPVLGEIETYIGLPASERTYTLYIQPPGKPLSFGSPCIYNSECTSCHIGYSQKCIANRCQCIATRDAYFTRFSPDKPPKGSVLDCVDSHFANPALVYYDRGLESCVVEKVKENLMPSHCPNHHKIRSVVDGYLYCMNAIDVIGSICSENEQCQLILNSSEFVGFCITGICHAMSVNNFTRYLDSDPHCDPNERKFCKEPHYQYTPITHERAEKCSNACQSIFERNGFPSTYSSGCLCFKEAIREPNLYIA